MLRLDELIFRSIEIMKELFPNVEIEMNFDGVPGNESLLLIQANESIEGKNRAVLRFEKMKLRFIAEP